MLVLRELWSSNTIGVSENQARDQRRGCCYESHPGDLLQKALESFRLEIPIQ